MFLQLSGKLAVHGEAQAGQPLPSLLPLRKEPLELVIGLLQRTNPGATGTRTRQSSAHDQVTLEMSLGNIPHARIAAKSYGRETCFKVLIL